MRLPRDFSTRNVHYTKIYLSSFIKKGCDFLSAFGNNDATRFYLDIAENYERRSVNELIHFSNSLCDAVNYYQHRLKIELSKLMKTVNEQ